MKLKISKILRFWVEIAYQDLREKRPDLSKYTLLAHVLRTYEARGLAMRYLNSQGKIAWKASPNLINKITDAERETDAEFEV
jgi:hypothetical protein